MVSQRGPRDQIGHRPRIRNPFGKPNATSFTLTCKAGKGRHSESISVQHRAIHRCPRCLKTFPTECRVWQHMNHPLTTCSQSAENLVAARSILRRRQPRRVLGSIFEDQNTPDITPPFQDVHEGEHLFDGDYAGDIMMDGDVERTRMEEACENLSSARHALPLNLDREDGKFKEFFPGAARVVDSGTTFMEDFNADIHADKRTDNIFYPFASREEMDFASFLLRSGLSLAKIDELLSLEIVCHI